MFFFCARRVYLHAKLALTGAALLLIVRVCVQRKSDENYDENSSTQYGIPAAGANHTQSLCTYLFSRCNSVKPSRNREGKEQKNEIPEGIFADFNMALPSLASLHSCQPNQVSSRK